MTWLCGQVEWVGGRWRVRADPDVRTRLRRLFGGVSQSAGDVISMPDTWEICRDLEWVLERYPMYMSDADARRLAAGARSHVDAEERLLALLNGHTPPPEVALAEPAREYQRLAAAAWRISRNLLLADDVGLGKTVSAISGLVASDHLPALVLCPPHLQRHWERAFERFAPQLLIHTIRTRAIYDLAEPDRKRRSKQARLFEPRKPDVLICSYNKINAWADELAGQIKALVSDECQQMRNSDTQIYAGVTHIAAKADYRLWLSATPIHNYGGEFFAVMDALAPGALGSREEFMREWCTSTSGKVMIKDPIAFGEHLRRAGLMLRRTRADVGRELPSLNSIEHVVDIDDRALKTVRSDAIRLAQIILAANERHRGERMQAAGEFDVLLRQATGIAKAPAVAEFVRLLVESGEPVLLFGWHRAVYSIWKEALADLDPVFYTGAESVAQKDAAVQAFVEGRAKVLIMSLRSGLGVDGLQAVCRNVVFGELDWSRATITQCIGRPHRDGQTESVNAFFVVAEGSDSMDPVMANTLGLKRHQLEGVIDGRSVLVQRVDDGAEQLSTVARAYLARHGVAPRPAIEVEAASA